MGFEALVELLQRTRGAPGLRKRNRGYDLLAKRT